MCKFLTAWYFNTRHISGATIRCGATAKQSNTLKACAFEQATISLAVWQEQITGYKKTFPSFPTQAETELIMKETDVQTSSSTSGEYRKRGMALIVTMMMLVVVTMSAVMLWNSSYLDSLIAGNKRRENMAKFSAQSGINHFMAMNFQAQDVATMLDVLNKATLIEPTQIPNTKQFYKVEVSNCCDQAGQRLPQDMFKVISTGYYGVKPNVMAEVVLEAFIQTRSE